MPNPTTKPKAAEALARQFTGASLGARVGRVITVGLGYMLGLKGIASAGWADLPGMMTPVTVIGLLVALIGAAYTGRTDSR